MVHFLYAEILASLQKQDSNNSRTLLSANIRGSKDKLINNNLWSFV